MENVYVHTLSPTGTEMGADRAFPLPFPSSPDEGPSGYACRLLGDASAGRAGWTIASSPALVSP